MEEFFKNQMEKYYNKMMNIENEYFENPIKILIKNGINIDCLNFKPIKYYVPHGYIIRIYFQFDESKNNICIMYVGNIINKIYIPENHILLRVNKWDLSFNRQIRNKFLLHDIIKIRDYFEKYTIARICKQNIIFENVIKSIEKKYLFNNASYIIISYLYDYELEKENIYKNINLLLDDFE